ncbi:MAG TPA: type 4a pilus biogenesis protein PilO [Candidatus Acidoferrales bacterium]|jgi:Tfp pilus assembly protein PilO|nr:type 4a pilus biogenesis protein PilO [Candidatus Acidoferrales bacterium]
MKRDAKLQKRLVTGALTFLVLADVALAAYSWRLSSAPHTPQQELALQNQQLEVLRADIKRGESIRQLTPAIQRDCDRFEQSLLPVSNGYSSVSAELDGIAKKAGAQIDGRGFKQKEIPKRGMQEVSIDLTVNGEYTAVVRFLNGLQRSKNLYQVDGLALASDAQSQGANGPIKVSVHMKTYFRVA